MFAWILYLLEPLQLFCDLQNFILTQYRSILTCSAANGLNSNWYGVIVNKYLRKFALPPVNNNSPIFQVYKNSEAEIR